MTVPFEVLDSALVAYQTQLSITDTIRLVIENLADSRGNLATSIELNVSYQSYQLDPGAIVINEIHSGLHEFPEFVELYNRGQKALDLYRCQFSDFSKSISLPHYMLQPGEFVALTSDNHLLHSERVIYLPEWPTLNNSSDQVSITDPYGSIVASIAYNETWHDILFMNDGHSYELIDPTIPCPTQAYWRASTNPGGTPGATNSSFQSITDTRGPMLESAFYTDSTRIEITFDEPLLRVLKLSAPSNSIATDSISDRKVYLTTEAAKPGGKSQIEIQVNDCWENPSKYIITSVVYPRPPHHGELVINEVLFNPEPGGHDFVEVYNSTNSFITTRGLSSTNLEDTAMLPDFIIPPQSFLVLTSSKEAILNRYPHVENDIVYQSKLPLLPDKEGRLFLNTSEPIDSIAYHEDLHHELLRDVEGVSLERLSMTVSGMSPDNWHSASTASGYATPGRMNSVGVRSLSGSFTVNPQVFQPGSSSQPFTTFTMTNHPVGSLASIHVYNRFGQLIYTVAEGSILGTEDFKTWDGTSSKGRRVPTGYYLAVLTVRHPEYGVKTYNQKVVVAFD